MPREHGASHASLSTKAIAIPTDTPHPTDPAASKPAANHLDLYLIVVGIVVGVLMGPGVLGKIKPDTYRAHFTSLREAYRLQTEFQKKVMGEQLVATVEQFKTIEKMRETGVSDEAVAEKAESFSFSLAEAAPDLYAEGLALDMLVASAHRQEGRRLALLIAIAVVMVMEAVLGDLRARAVRYLSVARYAMLAAWLALLIAQPSLLRELPGMFALLLIVASLAAAFVPMKSDSKDKHDTA